MLNVPIDRYGHVETVSSSNHTLFSPGQACQYFMHIYALVTDSNPSWISEKVLDQAGTWIYSQSDKHVTFCAALPLKMSSEMKVVLEAAK